MLSSYASHTHYIFFWCRFSVFQRDRFRQDVCSTPTLLYVLILHVLRSGVRSGFSILQPHHRGDIKHRMLLSHSRNAVWFGFMSLDLWQFSNALNASTLSANLRMGTLRSGCIGCGSDVIRTTTNCRYQWEEYKKITEDIKNRIRKVGTMAWCKHPLY